MYNVSLWSGKQCHLIHPSILWKFFWPSLAYIYVQIGRVKPRLFYFICLEYKVIHVDLLPLSVSDPFYQDASHADPGLNQQVTN